MSEPIAPPSAPLPRQPMPKPLRQTPQTVPGPGLASAPLLPSDKAKHHTLRKVRGTAASLTDKIKMHPTLPEAEKAYLAARVAAIKGDWITMDVHVFEEAGLVTVHAHIAGQVQS